MNNGTQQFFQVVPTTSDGVTIDGSTINIAVNSGLTGSFALNQNMVPEIASMWAVDNTTQTKWLRLLGVDDDEAAQAPSATVGNGFRNLAVMARLQGFDGTNYRRIKTDAAGNLFVTSAVQASNLNVNATAAANTAVTLTLPAAGAGLFHYITAIEIYRTCTVALLGGATLSITTTNLQGLAWNVGNDMQAGGTQIDVSMAFSSPVKSLTANTSSTIVTPVPGAAVLWMLNVHYYTGT